MADIVLAALNAKFIHPSLGLRYLLANLGPRASQTELLEFDLHHPPAEIAARMLELRPRVIGLGVYIWNLSLATNLASILKAVQPEVFVVLGGPEVSYETDGLPIVDCADYVIQGEGDLAFRSLCDQLLSGRRPSGKIVAADPPDLGAVAMPYDFYTSSDVAHRLLYVEASRGCPFSCEFCLSSGDAPVRRFPLPAFLDQMDRLWRRGARRFKFVDRTFNLHSASTRAILEFFLARTDPSLFLHLEIVPDRLTEEDRRLLAQFPPGSVQIEIGIQTFNPEVARRIRRFQDNGRLEENLRFLRRQTRVRLHADLLAGLPGETVSSFAAGFDRLVALEPHEIQIGLLKRLRGAPIRRHDAPAHMVYNPCPPYEILCNDSIDFHEMNCLAHLARLWELMANRSHFRQSLPRFWADTPSPFAGFRRWTEWLAARRGHLAAIALRELMGLAFEHLVAARGQPPAEAARDLLADYRRGGRSDIPPGLEPYA